MIVGGVEVGDLVCPHEALFLRATFFTPARHDSALRLEARIGVPSTSTNTGLVWDDGRMRIATQLLNSIGTSKATSRSSPSATISCFAMG